MPDKPLGMMQPLNSFQAMAARLRSHGLLLAQLSWLTMLLVVVGVTAVGLPGMLRHYVTFSGVGITLLPRPAVVQGLTEIGIPPAVYGTVQFARRLTVTLIYILIGVFIFWRRSDDHGALLVSLILVLFGWVVLGPTDLLVAVLPPTLIQLIANLTFMGLFVCCYLFPDGRFVPRWTRWPAFAMLASVTASACFPSTLLDNNTWPVSIAVPFQLSLLSSAPVAQVWRYKHVATPAQRQQTKWVMFAFIVTIASFLAFWTPVNVRTAVVQPGAVAALYDLIGGSLLCLAFGLVPVATAIALLRYRLWDIDPILTRTLVYSALTAVIAGVYLTTIGLLSVLFAHSGTVMSSLVASAAVALLFQPLRVRLQRLANRLLYGDRDEPYTALARLADRLEGTLAPAAVLVSIVESVRDALRLPYAALALWQNGVLAIRTSSGTPADETVVVPLSDQDGAVGQLILAPRSPGEVFSAADRRLLQDLARQAGVAVYAVCLTDDLQRTRERLVIAREEERRRLRRDLHDGLGPQLASQTLTIAAICKLLAHDPSAALELLHHLAQQSQDAIADIRRLIYALRPPALDDLGLVLALQEQATHYVASGVEFRIDAPDPLPPLSAAVEVATYRIVQEALTNVIRHAHAQRCTVHLRCERGLQVLIEDDGRGLAPGDRVGIGLHSMRERAAELGGTVTIEPRAGGGTRLAAWLPLQHPVQGAD